MHLDAVCHTWAKYGPGAECGPQRPHRVDKIDKMRSEFLNHFLLTIFSVSEFRCVQRHKALTAPVQTDAVINEVL